jgi:hypothetical protein
MTAIIGAAIFAVYLPTANAISGSIFQNSLKIKLSDYFQAIGYIFSTTGILLPVMWTSIITYPFFIWRLFQHNLISQSERGLFLVVTVAIALSFRGLFGSLYDEITNVPSASYPFFVILFVFFVYRALYLIFSGLAIFRTRTAISVYITLVIILSYSGLRAATAISEYERKNYVNLHTPAGSIDLADQASIDTYTFIKDNLNPGDSIVDVAYGGAINFALRRPDPVSTTQFIQLAPPIETLERDLTHFKASSPRFVIGTEKLPAIYGVNSLNKCPFPRLVWKSDTPAFDEHKNYPLIEYIKLEYHVVFNSGGMTVLAPLN